MSSTSGNSSLALSCLVEGDNTIFDVDAPTNIKISALKGLIHKGKDKRILRDVNVSDLILWKVDVDLKGCTRESLRNLKFEEGGNGTEELLDWARVSDYWEPPLAAKRIHIFVKLPAAGEHADADHGLRGMKRQFDEMVDPTDSICFALMKPFSPIPLKAQELVPLVSAPLLQKLPVDKHLFTTIKMSHPSISECLQPGIGELSIIISSALREETGRQAASSRSANMLIHPVDMLVRTPLQVISRRAGHSLEVDRNTTDPGVSTTLSSRPDFLLWVRDVLLFWGEEKARSGAKMDLERKFRVIDPRYLGDFKFMLCYSVNGSKIRFYAIDGTPKLPDPFIPLTPELEINDPRGRLCVLLAVINIARVLLTIRDVLPTDVYPLGKKIMYEDSELSFGPDFVRKTISVGKLPYSEPNLANRVKFLQLMYEHAKGRRGLVQLSAGPKLDKAKTYYSVHLETKGIRRPPTTEDDLRIMTKDLVCGLAFLHSGGFLHRDIRRPNIVYDLSRQQYVLIDFEHGGQDGGTGNQRTRKSKLKYVVPDHPILQDWDDSKTLDHGIYTKASDMYQLGKLLEKEFNFLDLSDQGRDFLDKLLGKQITAAGSLEHEWIRTLND